MKRVKEIKARVKRNRRQRDHTLRCVTIRTNDGTNQCQPPDVWATIAKRIALDS